MTLMNSCSFISVAVRYCLCQLLYRIVLVEPVPYDPLFNWLNCDCDQTHSFSQFKKRYNKLISNNKPSLAIACNTDIRHPIM